LADFLKIAFVKKGLNNILFRSPKVVPDFSMMPIHDFGLVFFQFDWFKLDMICFFL